MLHTHFTLGKSLELDCSLFTLCSGPVIRIDFSFAFRWQPIELARQRRILPAVECVCIRRSAHAAHWANRIERLRWYFSDLDFDWDKISGDHSNSTNIIRPKTQYATKDNAVALRRPSLAPSLPPSLSLSVSLPVSFAYAALLPRAKSNTKANAIINK